MVKKIKITQILRFIVQMIFFIFFSGLFVLAFSGIKEIYLAILKGSFSFRTLFPFIIEALTIVPLTIILGRFFCGWLCAFGALNDFIYGFTKRVFNIKFQVNETADSILKYLKYCILAFVLIFMWTLGTNMFDGFSPWDAFAQTTNFAQAFPDYVAGFIIFGFIIFGAAFIERFFCRYLCPLGAIFALTSRIRLLNIIKPTEKCGKCKLCTKSCAMGIALYKMDKVKSGECINCFKCVEACPRKNTQVGICNEALNPVLASTLAITAFTAVYSVSNMAVGSSNQPTANLVTSYNKVQSSDVSGGKAGNNAAANTTPNTSSSNSSSKAAPKGGNKYKDGTYTGVGNGFRPGLEVAVTIKNDKITGIEILSSNETPRYSYMPMQVVPNEIKQAQSTNVDSISGATRTSNGIKMAVDDALSQALVSAG